jgi:hypothetical protein
MVSSSSAALGRERNRAWDNTVARRLVGAGHGVQVEACFEVLDVWLLRRNSPPATWFERPLSTVVEELPVKLKVTHLGPVQNAEIDFSKPLVIQAGPNSTGKTRPAKVTYSSLTNLNWVYGYDH